ncbi:MAG: isochorismatase family protein [Actinomycetota bacterium]
MTGAVAGTRPYPWPFDGDLRAARVALVVAGAQDAWIARCHDPAAAASTLTGLAHDLRALGVLVVRVRQATVRGPADRAWPGVAWDRDVVASGVDGFFGSPLDGVLRAERRDLLAMCGFGLEGPVHSTLRSANDRGFECLTLTDASAALDTETAGPAVESITMSGGIFGAVGSSGALVEALRPGPTP